LDNNAKLIIGMLGIIASILVFYPTNVQAGSPVLQISDILASPESVIGGGQTITLQTFAGVNDTSIPVYPTITYSWSSTAGHFGCASCNTTTWTAPLVGSDTVYTITVIASASGYYNVTTSTDITVKPTAPTSSPPVSSPPSIGGFYIDTTDSHGNIKRHYFNPTDFSTHSDVGSDQLKYWRIMRVYQLNDTIQSLPDSNFTSPVLNSKATLKDDVNTLADYLLHDEFHFAISKINSIKEKTDGFEGGSATDDLIIDATAQRNVLSLLGDLTHTINLAAQPSDNFISQAHVSHGGGGGGSGSASTSDWASIFGIPVIGPITVGGSLVAAIIAVAGLAATVFKIK